MPGLIVQKKEMTRIADEKGVYVPVTAVFVPEHSVLHVKTSDKDGKNAIVLGSAPLRKPTKNRAFRFVREFDVTDPAAFEKGKAVGFELLEGIKEVRLSSTSKGKGFQGVMKRHNFGGGPGSHGSHFHREPGSIGQRAYPGKVMKGKKLPGHMGVDRVTLQERPIVQVDEANRMVYIKGSIPGHRNSVVELRF